MRHVVIVIGLILALTAPAAGQQTGLTDAQIKTADAEVPELARLLELKPGMTVADVGAGWGVDRAFRQARGAVRSRVCDRHRNRTNQRPARLHRTRRADERHGH